MATWRLDLYNRIGSTLVTTGLPWKSLQAKWVFNGPGSLEVDSYIDANFGATLPRAGQHEFRLFRDSTAVWAGPLWTVDVDADRHTVRFTAEGLLSWLKSRVVTSDLIYTSTNQQAIAWNLIAHTQGQTDGALGLVQGTHTGANIARKRFYCASERPNIYDALMDFCDLDNGLDIEIDPATRAFNSWNTQKKVATGLAFTGNNVDTLTWVEDSRDQLTYITGVADEECQPYLSDVSASAIAAVYGRRQDRLDVHQTDHGEVDERTREELRARKHPRWDATVTYRDGQALAPAWATPDIGGTCTLADDRGYSTFGPISLRILSKTLFLDDNQPGLANVELALASAVD